MFLDTFRNYIKCQVIGIRKFGLDKTTNHDSKFKQLMIKKIYLQLNILKL